MSELRDRLERLAARGRTRGVDDVLGAAMRGVPVEPVELASDDAYGADLPVIDDEVPLVSIEPGSHRRGRYGSMIAAVGVAALVGVGALAAAAMFGSGGAGSPEGAVRQLADAVSHKDPLSAVDVLVPTEVRSMRTTINDATKRAADLKIVDDASQPLAGIDLSVGGLQLSTETLADGYAKVTITGGTLSASTHAAAMSKLLQTALSNSSGSIGGSFPDGSSTSEAPASRDAQASVDLAHLASSSDLPTFVVTVRRDGRWYVSPAYTALEYAREVENGPAADFGSANAASLGADTPESAVTDALHAWQAGDWDRLMALAPPDELPVYDYRAWIDEAATGDKPDMTIDKLSTSATVNGDSAVVKLDASGTYGTGSDLSQWQVGGTCAATPDGYASYTYGDSGSSSSGQPEICLAGDLGQAIPFGLVFANGSNTPATGSVSIQVVKEDGRWFVSPVSTALDAVDHFVDHLDQQTLYPIIGLGYLLPPDATISLNQPFAVAADGHSTHVYAFDGAKGQSVVGAMEETGSDGYASGELYTADGHDVGFIDFVPGSADFAVDEFNSTLPSTGSYRLVVTGGLPKGATLTLFDSAHAPKSGSPSGQLGVPSGSESCTRTLTGESCSATSTATTVPASSRVTPTSAAGSTCVTTNNSSTCTYKSNNLLLPTPASVPTTTSVP